MSGLISACIHGELVNEDGTQPDYFQPLGRVNKKLTTSLAEHRRRRGAVSRPR